MGLKAQQTRVCMACRSTPGAKGSSPNEDHTMLPTVDTPHSEPHGPREVDDPQKKGLLY